MPGQQCASTSLGRELGLLVKTRAPGENSDMDPGSGLGRNQRLWFPRVCDMSDPQHNAVKPCAGMSPSCQLMDPVGQPAILAVQFRSASPPRT